MLNARLNMITKIYAKLRKVWLTALWKDEKFRLVLVQTLGLHKLTPRQTRQRERRGHMVMEKINTLVTNTGAEGASAEL